MSLKLQLLLGLCLLASTLGLEDRCVRYDNYRVYNVIPSSNAELSALKKFQGASDSTLFLKDIHRVGQDVNVLVAPHKVPDFLQFLENSGIENKLIERNFQRHLKSVQETYSRTADDYGWTKYYQLDENYDWLQSLAKKYPKTVTLIKGGRTYENRTILGVKISKKSGNRGIMIEAGIHAREWISPATATYIINQLLTSNDTSTKQIAQNYDWYIFPHINPDGYVYTHTTDRMWRLTRKPNGDGSYGVDPNRNWDIHWNEAGASDKPGDQRYAGPSAFSEIETKSFSNYITSMKTNIQLYISFHSYSQFIMYPYGYTDEPATNKNDFKQVSDAAVAAIKKRYGTKYVGGSIIERVGKASGSTIDWVYDKAGINMTFAYELRPGRGMWGNNFDLDASEIIPTGEETLDSVTALIGEVKNLGYFD